MTSFADMSWRFLRMAGARIVAMQVDLTVQGAEQLPAHGPVIVCANHEHHLLDGAILMSLSRRPTHIVVARDWAASGASKHLMPRLNRMARWPMVDRTDSPRAPSINRQAVHESAQLLTEGRILIVFPEGYPAVDPHGSRKRHGELLPFQPGLQLVRREAAKHSRKTVPVVSCGFTYRQVNENRWHVLVRFGPPVEDPGISTTNMREAVAALIG